MFLGRHIYIYLHSNRFSEFWTNAMFEGLIEILRKGLNENLKTLVWMCLNFKSIAKLFKEFIQNLDGKRKEKMSRKINYIISCREPPLPLQYHAEDLLYLCSIMQRASFTFAVSCRGHPLTLQYHAEDLLTFVVSCRGPPLPL